jgi:hypothetical protein
VLLQCKIIFNSKFRVGWEWINVTITPGQNILASIRGQTLNSNFDAIAPLTYLLTNKKDIWECLPDQILCKTATVLRDMLNSLATTPDSKLSHSYHQIRSGQGWDWIMFNSEGVIKSDVREIWFNLYFFPEEDMTKIQVIFNSHIPSS